MKNKKLLKFIFSFLILFIFIILFVSCKSENNKINSGEKPADDSGLSSDNENFVEEIRDSLPNDLNFNGETINIFTRGDCNVDTEVPEFGVESENGDIINDIIYKRDKIVEDRLNIKIKNIKGNGWQDYNKDVSKIRASISAGDNSYDLIAGWSARIPALSVDGLLLNLHDLPYLNLTERWWNKIIVDEMTINNKLHFAVGDGNLSLLANCMVIFVNNKIQQDYGLPNIYDTVFDGKWTIDYMSELTKDMYKDLNGDGIRNEYDLYGAFVWEYNRWDGFLQGSNIRMTKMDENGIPYLEMEYEKIANIVEKVYNLVYKNAGSYTTKEAWNYSYNMFKNDQILFAPGWLLATMDLRDMETDYSMIPYPKYDEAQEKYYTRIQDGVSLFCITITCDKTEMVGAFMEAAASESYKNVSPTYFEIAMKVKYARDETSSKMLDIIREGAYLNFASIYNESIGNPWFVVRELIGSKSNKFASWYDKNEQKISKAIDKLIDKMENAG